MNKVSRTPEGATQIEMPSGRHPESHFETHRLSIERAKDGNFILEHHKSLKKKFEGMRHMDGGWRDSEKSVVASEDPAHAHLTALFNGKKASDNDE